jgi:hypothetical protein
MTPAQRERWRIHREHCTAPVCWGPAACATCHPVKPKARLREDA